MSENQNSPDFSIPTSREYLIDKAIEEIKKHTYINPLFDAGFKAFLCDEQSLVSFLNGVFHLKEKNRIESVIIKNSEINVIFPVVKPFRLDIRARTSNGISINVEMQKARPDYFVDRIFLQHSAFMLQSKFEWDQLNFGNLTSDISDEERAKREIHRYEVPPTYAIWICDFSISQQKTFRGDWAVRDKEGLTLSDKMMYITYDLTRFTKTIEEVSTVEERWFYVLKHAGSAEKLTDFNDRDIAKAIRRLLVNSASERLIKDQASDMVWTEEELDRLALYKIRARERARAEGLAEGLAEGRAEGFEQGRSQEREKMALDMLADNKPIDEIVKYSHLSKEKVLELQNKQGFNQVD